MVRIAVLVHRPAAILAHQRETVGSRLETLEVIRIAGEFVHRKISRHLHHEARARRVARIDFLLARRQVLGAVFRLVVVEHRIRMRLRPGKSLQGGILQVFRISIVPALARDDGTQREGLRRRICGHRVGSSIVAATFRGGRRGRMILVDHRKHRAVLVLHAEHMVQAPLHLVENVGDAVPRFGNVVVVRKCTRLVHVGTQKRLHVVAVPHRILVEVSRIEPAAAQVAFRRRVRAIRKQARRLVLLVVHAVGPFLARVCSLLRHAHTLVEHHAHRRLQDIIIHIVPNAEIEGLFQVIGLVADVIRARSRDARKIEPPDFIAGRRIDSALLEGDRGTRKNYLCTRAIHHFHGLARSVRKRGICTHLRRTQHRDLLRVGAVTELVDSDENILGDCRGHSKKGRQEQPPNRKMFHARHLMP